MALFWYNGSKKFIRKKAAMHDEKDLRIEQLKLENQKLQEKIDRLEHNVEALTQAVLHAAKQRFGASSEKTPSTVGQASLFDEEDADNIPVPYATVIQIKEHKRPLRKKAIVRNSR